MKKLRFLFISLLLFLSACTKAEIEIENAYTPIRTEQQRIFAAYLDIKNNTTKPIELTGIKSTSFGSVMLHQSSVENGMAKMRHIESLIIPQKKTVKLEPNGKHIMLMQATEKLWEKDNFILTIEFSNGSSIDQTITLKK